MISLGGSHGWSEKRDMGGLRIRWLRMSLLPWIINILFHAAASHVSFLVYLVCVCLRHVESHMR